MKYTANIKWAIALLPLLASCAQVDEESNQRIPLENEIRFTGNIRAISRATGSMFDSGDAISVFAFNEGKGFNDAAYASNKKYVYQGSQFVAASTENAIVQPAAGTALAYHAIYPYNASASGSFVFEVKKDQNTGSNYTLSDLMTASTIATADKVPALKFRHRMSSVVLNVSFDVAPAGNLSASIENVATSALVNLTTDFFQGTGMQDQRIEAALNGTNSFIAILPPQSMAIGTLFIKVKTEGGTEYSCKMAQTTEWKSGVQYTYKLHVNAKDEVTLTAEINPWKEEGDYEEPIDPVEPVGKLLKRMEVEGKFAQDSYTVDLGYDNLERLSQLTMSSIGDFETPVVCNLSYTGNTITVKTTILPSNLEAYSDTIIFTQNSQGYIGNIQGHNSDGKNISVDLDYANDYLASLTASGTTFSLDSYWTDGKLMRTYKDMYETHYTFDYTIGGAYTTPINMLASYLLTDLSVLGLSDFLGTVTVMYLPNQLFGKGFNYVPTTINYNSANTTSVENNQYSLDKDNYIEKGESTREGVMESVVRFTYKQRTI